MTLKIATRSSKLALAQVEEFVSEYNISDYKIIKIKTEGDVKSSKERRFLIKLTLYQIFKKVF